MIGSFLKCALVIVAFVAANGSLLANRPNILVILADDMGFSDIGCYGSEISTPNLDKLAANGLRYTQFYNAARCCPTRASLLTGLYPHQTGIGNMVYDQRLPAYRGDLNEHCVTIAQVLKPAGYKTFLSGKWHVTKHSDMFRTWLDADKRHNTSKHNWPLQRGFDEFFGTIHGAGSFFEPSTLVRDNEPVDGFPDGFYYTDAISDFAVDFIKRHDSVNASQPFFGYIAYTAPHWPLHAKPEDIKKYSQRYTAGWDVLREERLNRQKLLGFFDASLHTSERNEEAPAWADEPDKAYYAHCMAVYAAQVDAMDAGIGRVITALEETGQLDNTLVFFLSDNGGCAEVLSEKWPRSLHVPYKLADGSPVFRGMHKDHLPGPANTYASYGPGWANASNTPFSWFKHYIQEGGISTPLIIHWPDAIAPASRGGFIQQVGHVKDIMATVVDAADADYPESFKGNPITPMEGISLLPNLEGRLVDAAPLFWEHHGNRGMRKGYWKIVSVNNGPWQLFNISTDRIEARDLAESHPEIAASMVADYQEWADRVGVVENPGKPIKP